MKLKIWNGRGLINGTHIYVCAYSKADAIRLVREIFGYEPRGMRAEINDYWSENCWGTVMNGITPERGIWMSMDGPNRKPVRLQPGFDREPWRAR